MWIVLVQSLIRSKLQKLRLEEIKDRTTLAHVAYQSSAWQMRMCTFWANARLPVDPPAAVTGERLADMESQVIDAYTPKISPRAQLL